MMARALREALGSGPNSTRLRQEGRMLGSRSNRLSLQPSRLVTITREGSGAFMNGPVFLSVTANSEPLVRVEGDNLIAAPRQSSRPGATDQPNSDKDWANAMRFFEVNPYASAEDALSKIQWSAGKNSNKNYRKSAAKQAITLVRPRIRGRAPHPGVSSPPRATKTRTQSAPPNNTHAEDEKPGGKRPRTNPL